MSIIEQTLDKLERSASSMPDQVIYEPYEYEVHHPASAYGKSWKIFIVLFGILLMMAFFVISQGVKLKISVAQEQSIADKKSILAVNNTENIPPAQILKNEELSIDSSKTFDRSKTFESPEVFDIRTPLSNTTKIETQTQKASSTQNAKHTLKSDLSTALLVDNTVSKKTQSLQKRIPKKQVGHEILESIVSNKIAERNSFPDLANLIPQQINMGNYQDVINILQQYRQKLANTWEYYYWQSQAYIGMGQLDRADDTLDIGLKKDSKKALLWIQKGLILQEKGNHLAAIEIFKKVEFMHLKTASLYLNLGYSAAAQGDLLLTKRAYNQYLKISENDPEHDSSIRNQVMEYLKQIN